MKMKSAWLVTWEWNGDHASVDKKVVTVINYRKRPEYVKNLIEQLYIAHDASDVEAASYAKDRKTNPYPASFAKVNGADWGGRISCGSNPELYARKVCNIKTKIENGKEVLTWDDIPIPSFPSR